MGGGPPLYPDHDVMKARDDVAAAAAAAAQHAQHAKVPRNGRKTPEVAANVPPAAPSTTAQHPAPSMPRGAPPHFVPGQQAAIPPAGDVELSVDLLSGPIHRGTMSAIPEVTEPLTGHISTGGLEISGLHHRAPSRAMSADVMSPMGPPADSTIASLQPSQPPAVWRQEVRPGPPLDARTQTYSAPARPPSGPRSGGSTEDRPGRARR